MWNVVNNIRSVVIIECCQFRVYFVLHEAIRQRYRILNAKSVQWNKRSVLALSSSNWIKFNDINMADKSESKFYLRFIYFSKVVFSSKVYILQNNLCNCLPVYRRASHISYCDFECDVFLSIQNLKKFKFWDELSLYFCLNLEFHDRLYVISSLNLNFV